MTLKLLLTLKKLLMRLLLSQSDNILTSLDFTELQTEKPPLGRQLLQNLRNGTDVLQNLLTCKKLLQNYRMEQKHWKVSYPCTPQ